MRFKSLSNSNYSDLKDWGLAFQLVEISEEKYKPGIAIAQGISACAVQAINVSSFYASSLPDDLLI